MYALIIGFVILVVIWIVEYHRHQFYRNKIPDIVHVNGTRGKSSVTRLLAAGLRAGGLKAMAKTTGSAPVLIFEKGHETPIVRHHGANIKEQLKIIKYVAKRNIDVLVLECMAVNPEYQWVTERHMVRSTIGVVTNSRPDHLDLMGPGIRNVTLSLCNSLPKDGNAFTAEWKMFPLMKKQAAKYGTNLQHTPWDDISDEDMKGFNHIEHKENVALALKVCAHFGIKRDVALKGMYTALPDVGACEIFMAKYKSKNLYFAHSFAANDPESTVMLIKYIRSLYKELKSVAIVLSTRADRMFRSEQLCEMVAEMEFTKLILIGDQPAKVKSYALNYKVPNNKLADPGWVTGDELAEIVMDIPDENILLFGVGNIHGNGHVIVDYFKERNVKNV